MRMCCVRQGETLSSGSAPGENGVISFAYTLPADAPGGEYSVKVCV